VGLKRCHDPAAKRRAGLAGDRHTDMRKGFASLSLQLRKCCGGIRCAVILFCFRGRSGNLLRPESLLVCEAIGTGPVCTENHIRL
jgi:hypothetical protein